MSDAPPLSFPEAARDLGVSLGVLRRAIRAGKLPAPPQQGATAAVPLAWLNEARDAIAANPTALNRIPRTKVPPFARYEGTSAWRKYAVRVREYRHFRAHAAGVTSAA